MVSSLTTAAYIATLDRFVARRSLPEIIYSDCGTNFVGAARKLREATAFLKAHHDQLYEHFTLNHIRWHFNPPAAPNFGGLWEAVVKSTKYILHRILSVSAQTFEEYSTIFTRIEAILNIRPLCQPINDSFVDYLTPGHFLIGTPLLPVPEPTLSETTSSANRWDHLKRLHQSFWKRWYSKFLNTLLVRSKWVKSFKPVEIGGVVFLTGLNSHPLSWSMGRVVKFFPDPDNVVSLVTVKTATRIYTRPVSKLISLPLDM